MHPFNIMDDTQSLSDLLSEVASKGVFTAEYWEALFSLLLFWYNFAYIFVIVIVLLYYRKFSS